LAMRRPNKQLPESSGRWYKQASDDMERQKSSRAGFAPLAMISALPPASNVTVHCARFTLIRVARESLPIMAVTQVPAHRPP